MLTISRLPESARKVICDDLNARLSDGIDLYSAAKQAHWNVKGPSSGSLHQMFDTIAGDVAEINDRIAERIVALGGVALGTIQIACAKSSIAPYPVDLFVDMGHVKALALRLGEYRAGLRTARLLAEQSTDAETANMLQEIILLIEKRGAFLLTHVDPAGAA